VFRLHCPENVLWMTVTVYETWHDTRRSCIVPHAVRSMASMRVGWSQALQPHEAWLHVASEINPFGN
jgi:hypothetical protein